MLVSSQGSESTYVVACATFSHRIGPARIREILRMRQRIWNDTRHGLRVTSRDVGRRNRLPCSPCNGNNRSFRFKPSVKLGASRTPEALRRLSGSFEGGRGILG
jgi:hypothetical protein